jgi:PD-(D/E)XK nuclease superfamily
MAKGINMPTLGVLNPATNISYRIETWDIRERDIDLLLIEELYSSPEFRQHFFRLINSKIAPGVSFPHLPPETSFVAARHSVSSPLGQSDVEVELEVADNRCMLMIENKIDASFQPEQVPRYERRAQKYRANGYLVLTILVAPGSYIGANTFGFNVSVTYEELLSWFTGERSLGDRNMCKTALLKAAIEKSTEDSPTKDPRSIAFFGAYYKVAKVIAPELRMRDQVRGGGFLYFRPANLPKYLYLMHRIRKGYVDLQFRGEADNVDDLRLTFKEVLPGNFEVRRVNGSAAIGLKVEELDRTDDFEKQRKKVEDAIRKAKDLWAWFLRNRDLWEQR